MAHDNRGRRRGGAVAAATANADTLRFPRAGSAADRRSTAGARVQALAFPLLVFAVHWLVVQLAASWSYHNGAPNPIVSPPYRVAPPTLTGLAHYVVEPLRQWDGLWYRLIAIQGYGQSTPPFEAAFWPFFPWLMELGNRFGGWPVETVGYAIGHAAFAVALVLLYKLVDLDFDRAVARRALWAIALFPTAFFFSAVYTESLFLMLAVGALLAARRGRWWVAGAVGALAALTRSYGILLLVPFAVLFLQQYRLELRRWFPNAVGAALPLLGPAIFSWHLERVNGNWRASFEAQTGWDRYASNPLDTLRCAVASCHVSSDALGNAEPDGATWGWLRALVDSPRWGTVTDPAWRLDVANSDTLELVCTALFFALAIVGLRALPLYQSAYLVPGLLVPLFQPSIVHALMSMPRFGLTLFPLFVVLALVIRRRALAIPALVVSALLLVLLTAQFADWYWVS